MKVDDATLRDKGLTPDQAAPVLVIGCGALAREILAITKTNGMDHLALACLPAILHNRPEQIAPKLDEMLSEAKSHHARIFVAYADCGSGGQIQEVCARHGVEMLEGPHCYSFFDGNAQFAARDEVTAFYLTDFLARQFDAFVTKPLGLDRHPELRDMYFGNYERLVYLAQTEDAGLEAEARRAADTLGLVYERRFTGYGDLAPALQALTPP